MNSPELLKDARERGGGPLPETFEKVFEEPLVATRRRRQRRRGLRGLDAAGDRRARSPFLGQGSELIKELPADSWLAMAQPDFGKLLDFYVDAFAGVAGGRDVIEQQFKAATGLDLQKDVLDWMGDFGVFVRGTSVADLDGALDHRDQRRGRVRALHRPPQDSWPRPRPTTRATASVPLAAPGGGEGFTLASRELPQPIHAVPARTAAWWSRTATRPPPMPSTRASRSATRAGYSQAARLARRTTTSRSILPSRRCSSLVDSTGAATDADWQKAKPYLEPLSALVGGTSGDGDELTLRVQAHREVASACEPRGKGLPQGHAPADPVPLPHLRGRVPRPRERELRAAPARGRPRLQRHDLRARRRHLLARLRDLRRAEQPRARSASAPAAGSPRS